jgi:hypothetical protein
MKSIIIFLGFCVLILLILFFWNELPDLSFSKKINAEKVSSFFIAIGSLLTAVTAYLLFNQIREQVEDRKASNRPDLYPAFQFFTMIQNGNMPKLTRENREETLIGLISLHNIGFGAAKEIAVKWHFQKDVLAKLIHPDLVELYAKRETERNYSFVRPNNQIEVQLPLMYLASLSSFKPGWAAMIWEELFLEISYKDILDFDCPVKKFKVDVRVGAHFASFTFTRTNSIALKDQTSIANEDLQI